MKKLLFILIAFIFTNSVFGQSEIVPEMKKFEDVDSQLYLSKVIEVPNQSQSQLVNRFKNWASLNFVSLKDVIVSETENQIVLVYITEPNFWFKSLGMKSVYGIKFYVRLVVQFKDGKSKFSFYDDGNVLSISGPSTPYIPARTQYISEWSKTAEKPTPQDYRKPKYLQFGVVSAWQSNVDKMVKSLENGLSNESTGSQLSDDF
jgi:hypothetical protein